MAYTKYDVECPLLDAGAMIIECAMIAGHLFCANSSPAAVEAAKRCERETSQYQMAEKKMREIAKCCVNPHSLVDAKGVFKKTTDIKSNAYIKWSAVVDLAHIAMTLDCPQ